MITYTICFSYPILGYTARELIDKLIFKPEPVVPMKRIVLEALGIATVTYILAASVPGVEFVFRLVIYTSII
jgi:hypothetical protein